MKKKRKKKSLKRKNLKRNNKIVQCQKRHEPLIPDDFGSVQESQNIRGLLPEGYSIPDPDFLQHLKAIKNESI